MTQSTTPHEFRKLSDNDTVCAECGQGQHEHDRLTEHQNEQAATSQQNEQAGTSQHDERDAASVPPNEPDSASPQQQERVAASPEQHEDDVASTQPDRADVASPEEALVAESIYTGVLAEAGTGRAMKYRNPWLIWLLWPLITLGIYHLVWYYKIHREMAEFQPKRNIPVAGPVLVLIFLGWTIIAPFISYYNTGNRIREAQRAAGMEPTCSPLLGGLLMFAFGVNAAYFQLELNRIIDRYDVPEGTVVQLYD